jgi:uncharacterized membrane protein
MSSAEESASLTSDVPHYTRLGLPRLTTALVLLAIAFGIFFRFYDLGQKLVWHDEVSTRILAGGHLHHEWKSALYTGRVVTVDEVLQYQEYNPGRSALETVKGLAADDPQHPPLYYVLSRSWMGLFGDAIGTLRGLSALLSLLCLPAIFWFSKELFRSAQVAWRAVALAAVSPLLILYAQEAREYALWTAVVLLANAALLRAIRLTEDSTTSTKRCAWAWSLYGVFTALGLYTSFSTGSVIIAQLVFLAIRERVRLSRVTKFSVLTLALVFLLFLPWIIILLRNYEAFAISMKWSREIVVPPLVLFRILAVNASRSIIDLWHEPQALLAWLAIAITLAAVVWALAAATRKAPHKAGLLVGTSILVPLALLLGPDLLFGGIRSVSARYLLPSWMVVEVALAFLVSRGNTPRTTLPSQLAFTALLVVGTVSSAHNARQVSFWTKGISFALPTVADHINGAEHPLLIGNMEQYHPGNLMALSNRLDPHVRMQFLRPEMEATYMLPPNPGQVFMMSPTIQFREGLEAREHVKTRLVYQDIYMQLWTIDPLP